MYNRVLNQKDLNLFKNQIAENDYPTKFPHIDLWGKDDAILKWLSVVNEFENLNKTNLKVVDLGSGSGCVPHIISSLGNDVTAIDISNIDHFCSTSLVKMVLNDVLIEIKEMKTRSVDIFTDICAVTHFNIQSNDSVSNIGWKEVADQVYRVLKKNGKFIVSSDVDISNDIGEFIKPQNIIDMVESSGLKLHGEYDVDSENTDFYIPYNGLKLQVACLVFVKP